jgi:hypothetical protein
MDDRHPDSLAARDIIDVSGAGWTSSASTRCWSA